MQVTNLKLLQIYSLQVASYMSISAVNWTIYFHQDTEISFFFLSHWRETNIYKDPYLDAKNHPTLDGITIVSFDIKDE